jgi:hypothetical protein
MDITQRIQEEMRMERLLFVYRGVISETNSLPLLTLLENEMKEGSFSLAGRKRLFMYVLESLQNIIKHGEQSGNESMSLVAYSKTDDGYKISTVNRIASDNVPELKSRLDRVNRLDIGEIKDLYRHILCSTEFSTKGGAGLGLLEMAIKTGNRIDYDFVPVNKQLTSFILSKTVDSTGTGINSGRSGEPFESNRILHLEQLMSQNSIYMIWSGHLTSGIGEEVLSITEARLTEEDIDSALRKRVFNIMIEILENVSKYNPGRETEQKLGMPVVMVRIDKEQYLLTTGNLILNSSIGDLKEKLDRINSYDRKGLKDLFFSSLSAQTFDTDSTGNMGLISMALKSGGRLNYNFEKVNDQYSYFGLTIRVEENQV